MDCPLLTMTGVPCPMCGATRSTLGLLRLDGSWLSYNPFWPTLMLLVVGVGVLLLAFPDRVVSRSLRTLVVSTARRPVAAVVTVLVTLAAGWGVALLNADAIRA